MKKLFTLVLSLGLLSSVFAQSGHRVASPRSQTVVVKVDHHDEYARMDRDKSAQIDRINREYNAKINAVQRNRFLKNGEKKRQINMLEKERSRQIAAVNAKYAHKKW